MSSLSLRDIRKTLGGNPILRGIDLEVADGALVVLVGPSGCGKSTLLRTIAGLEVPDAGAIRIGTREVTRLAPRDRDVAMVFQSYALYPHLDVRANLAFGLKLRGEDPKRIADRVDEVARMLGLEKLLDRYPRQMSGGQRQRVAMGRAIARRPSLFLFDEPLSNLDAALRAEVRVEIKRLHHELKATMIYVTHDQVEAMTLADQLVVLRAGQIEQAGPPLEIYHHPASRFVASFMGSPAMNFIAAELDGRTLRAPGVALPLENVPSGVNGHGVLLGVRPHDLLPYDSHREDQRHGYRTRSGGLEEGAGIAFRVDVVEAMGFEAYAHGDVGGSRFVARLEGAHARDVSPGDTLRLGVAEGALHLFDAETERALR